MRSACVCIILINSWELSFQVPLNDSHTNAFIAWVGYTPDVVALTKSSSSNARRSNLYISTDYGRHFVDVVKSKRSCLCLEYSNGTVVNASVDNLYHASATQKTYSSAVSGYSIIP